MKHYTKHVWMVGLLAAAACVTEDDTSASILESQTSIPNNHPFQNELGTSATFSTAGSVDLTNEFFQEFGTNGRHCGHCHKPAEGWTVSASSIRQLFDRTDGLDPIFRTNDGSNSPTADVSTVEARRSAYSMLLNRGTIRVGIGIPAGAQFELIAVDDPYGHASAAELSLFRRPLPSANLAQISRVMWDGRVAEGNIHDSLAAQSNGATQGHAEAPMPLPQEVREAIVAFETGLFNAQVVAHDTGNSKAEGGKGGPEALASQAFVNARFDLFDSWANSDNEARRAAFRGQELFNTRRAGTGPLTCRGCHNAQNVGSNTIGIFFNVNVSAASRRQADQPLYTFRRLNADGTVFQPETIRQTTDPGRALITGIWTNMDTFKVPSIRGLGARAPYMHDGSIATLPELVKFYEGSLNFNFTDAEEADLVAFLSAL